MAGFIRRFTSAPSIETLTEIEAVTVVDLPPQAPAVGVGTGAVMIVGEFEDGPFATGGDASFFDSAYRNQGPQEIFGSEDMVARFGGFGFTHSGVKSSAPCARRHLSELWNGNGFLKTKFLSAKRIMLARVDTSVGEVAFSAQASIGGTKGPYQLVAGQQISVTTDTGGPVSSTAIAAVPAARVGSSAIVSTGYLGGEQIRIAIDANPEVTVTFASTDQTAPQVAARINAALGFAAATESLGILTISGTVAGTAGRVTLSDVTAGALAALFHTAGTTNGTGNVANVNAVTPAEVAAIINGTAALTAINCTSALDGAGRLQVRRSSGGGTISIAAGAMATALGLDPVGTTVAAGVHPGGSIPAGTRVGDGSSTWVTMQTLSVPAGTATAPQPGPFSVKVRPLLDDGSAAGAPAASVTTVTDQASWALLSVTNPLALSAAKNEVQMDNAYLAAFDATLDPTKVTREANYSISARRSTEVVRRGRQNAIDASSEGLFGRKFISGAPIGYTQSQAIADVALWRSDRFLGYTWPGVKVRIPEIAEVGVAGGLGFTADGVITVRADNPLAVINARLNPEENPGQLTEGLVDYVLGIEDLATPLRMSNYIALKAAGICAPRMVDSPNGGQVMVFQSGVTTSLTPGLKTQARRKMADFIQDSLARAILPYVKKLGTLARRDAIRGIIEQFLGGLQSAEVPDNQRINSYLVNERDGQTETLTALGVFVYIIKVRTLSSMDDIVLQTEIGEGVVTITEPG
jgi:hypothetical protein